jgi:outer membrane lipoprotein-sorting protein
MSGTTISNIINHIVLVLDASSSMGPFANELVKVADKQIAYLAQRSKELDQETRITVYTFATKDYYGSPDIRCLIYDKDQTA